jgi:cytochrome b subunit of formate dehydrogenase
VDPGSQTAFRVRLQASESLGDTAKLCVSYYNIFNERDARELPISITRVQPKVEEKPSGQALPAIYGISLLTIVLVAIFLVLVGLLIFRLYRSHMKKMRSEAAVQ